MWLKPVFIFSDYGYVISEIRNVNNDGFDLREKLVCCLVELSASSFATAEKKSEMTKFHREILKMYNNSIWTNGSVFWGFFLLRLITTLKQTHIFPSRTEYVTNTQSLQGRRWHEQSQIFIRMACSSLQCDCSECSECCNCCCHFRDVSCWNLCPFNTVHSEQFAQQRRYEGKTTHWWQTWKEV